MKFRIIDKYYLKNEDKVIPVQMLGVHIDQRTDFNVLDPMSQTLNSIMAGEIRNGIFYPSNFTYIPTDIAWIISTYSGNPPPRENDKRMMIRLKKRDTCDINMTSHIIKACIDQDGYLLIDAHPKFSKPEIIEISVYPGRPNSLTIYNIAEIKPGEVEVNCKF